MKKYDEVLIKCAQLWAQESYCVKGQVGAVIADEGRIVATGYNGTVHGKPNVCEIEIPNIKYDSLMGELSMEPKTILKTSDYTVHAEQNVISFCAKQGIPIYGLTMYITLSPCAICAKLIVQSGIKRVVYLNEYKNTNGIDFLKDCGIEVEQYEGETL